MNILNGNLKMSDYRKQNLRKYKSLFRKVADKRVASSAKKRLINQLGEFLLQLLTAVLPMLANLLFRPRAN